MSQNRNKSPVLPDTSSTSIKSKTRRISQNKNKSPVLPDTSSASIKSNAERKVQRRNKSSVLPDTSSSSIKSNAGRRVLRRSKSSMLPDTTSASIKPNIGMCSSLSSNASLENETILSNDSNVNINNIIWSSFLERTSVPASLSEINKKFKKGCLSTLKLNRKRKRKSKLGFDTLLSSSSLLIDTQELSGNRFPSKNSSYLECITNGQKTGPDLSQDTISCTQIEQNKEANYVSKEEIQTVQNHSKSGNIKLSPYKKKLFGRRKNKLSPNSDVNDSSSSVTLEKSVQEKVLSPSRNCVKDSGNIHQNSSFNNDISNGNNNSSLTDDFSKVLLQAKVNSYVNNKLNDLGEKKSYDGNGVTLSSPQTSLKPIDDNTHYPEKQDNVFMCPEVPVHKSRTNSGENPTETFVDGSNSNKKDNSSDEKDCVSLPAKQMKKVSDKTINELSYDTLLDVSEIPVDKTINQKKLIYHSTPINPVLEKNHHKTRNSIKGKALTKYNSDKIMQVSKSFLSMSPDMVSRESRKKPTEEFSTLSKNDQRAAEKRKSNDSDKMCYSRDAKQVRVASDISTNSKLSNTSFSGNKNEKSSTLNEKESFDTLYRDSPTIRVLRSGSLLTSLRQSTDNLNSSCKQVHFRRYVSIYDSQTQSNIQSSSKEGTCISNDSRKKDKFDVTATTPSRLSFSRVSEGMQSDQATNHEESMKINITTPQMLSCVQENFTSEANSSINEKTPNMSKACEHSVTDSQIISAENVGKSVVQTKLTKKRQTKARSQFYLVQKRKPPKYDFSSDPRFMINGAPYVPPTVGDKWVTSNLLKYCFRIVKEKHGLRATPISQLIISHLCASVSAVKNLSSFIQVDSHTVILRNILKEYGVCSNLLEYYSFIMKFTPYDFQRKVLPLGGYFGSFKRPNKNCKINDDFISKSEMKKVS